MPLQRPSQPLSQRPRGAMLGRALLLLSVLAPAVDAQQGCPLPATIAADRPGNLTMPLVLPVGHVQLETGSSIARSGDVRSQTIGATLVRIGVSCGAELRLATGGWLAVEGAGARSRGLADVWAGTKIRLARGGGIRPHLAILSGVLLPTHTVASHQRTEVEANVSAMWDLPRAQTAALFTGVASRWTGGAFVNERLSGASWAFPVGALASFVEYSEYVRPGAASRYVTSGLQVFPRASVQLDVSVTLPIPRASSDAALGLGLSRRW